MAFSMKYVVVAAVLGLGVASFSTPSMAQVSKEEHELASENSSSSKYELLDEKGHDIGTLADKSSSDIGDRDPDATYLLQELDSENELAKK